MGHGLPDCAGSFSLWPEMQSGAPMLKSPDPRGIGAFLICGESPKQSEAVGDLQPHTHEAVVFKLGRDVLGGCIAPALEAHAA